MDDLEAVRARIPGYADYGNGDARHEVDKQIRAYLGERSRSPANACGRPMRWASASTA